MKRENGTRNREREEKIRETLRAMMEMVERIVALEPNFDTRGLASAIDLARRGAGDDPDERRCPECGAVMKRTGATIDGRPTTYRCEDCQINWDANTVENIRQMGIEPLNSSADIDAERRAKDRDIFGYPKDKF